jgi:hypothetical protein
MDKNSKSYSRFRGARFLKKQAAFEMWFVQYCFNRVRALISHSTHQDLQNGVKIVRICQELVEIFAVKCWGPVMEMGTTGRVIPIPASSTPHIDLIQ